MNETTSAKRRTDLSFKIEKDETVPHKYNMYPRPEDKNTKYSIYTSGSLEEGERSDALDDIEDEEYTSDDSASTVNIIENANDNRDPRRTERPSKEIPEKYRKKKRIALPLYPSAPEKRRRVSPIREKRARPISFDAVLSAPEHIERDVLFDLKFDYEDMRDLAGEVLRFYNRYLRFMRDEVVEFASMVAGLEYGEMEQHLKPPIDIDRYVQRHLDKDRWNLDRTKHHLTILDMIDDLLLKQERSSRDSVNQDTAPSRRERRSSGVNRAISINANGDNETRIGRQSREEENLCYRKVIRNMAEEAKRRYEAPFNETSVHSLNKTVAIMLEMLLRKIERCGIKQDRKRRDMQTKGETKPHRPMSSNMAKKGKTGETRAEKTGSGRAEDYVTAEDFKSTIQSLRKDFNDIARQELLDSKTNTYREEEGDKRNLDKLERKLSVLEELKSQIQELVAQNKKNESKLRKYRKALENAKEDVYRTNDQTSSALVRRMEEFIRDNNSQINGLKKRMEDIDEYVEILDGEYEPETDKNRNKTDYRNSSDSEGEEEHIGRRATYRTVRETGRNGSYSENVKSIVSGMISSIESDRTFTRTMSRIMDPRITMKLFLADPMRSAIQLGYDTIRYQAYWYSANLRELMTDNKYTVSSRFALVCRDILISNMYTKNSSIKKRGGYWGVGDKRETNKRFDESMLTHISFFKRVKRGPDGHLRPFDDFSRTKEDENITAFQYDPFSPKVKDFEGDDLYVSSDQLSNLANLSGSFAYL